MVSHARFSSRIRMLAGLAFIAATQVVCSSAAPEPTENPPPNEPPANQPPSGTVLLQEDFEDANLASREWYDIVGAAVSTQEHVTGSNASAHFRFLSGATNATFRGARKKFTPTSSLYIRYYVKYSANWVGSGRSYHPHEFYIQSTMDTDFNGPANAWMTLYVEHNYQNGGRPRLAMQDNRAINTSMGPVPNNLIGTTEDRSTSGCNGVVETAVQSSCFNQGYWFNDKGVQGPVTFQPNQGPGYKNDWNLVEAYFQLNTVVNGIAQQNGIMRYWFNGTQVIDRADILFRTAARPSIQWNQLLIAPYIGDGSPADQTMFIDNLVLATSR